MSDALRKISTRTSQTPQGTQADPRETRNNAGGYVFQQPDIAHLHRFLTLGTEGGTYYVKEPVLTKNNAETVIKMAGASDSRLIDAVKDISLNGRAPRQNPGLFALAAAAGLGDTPYRQRALDALPQVARTGYALLTFTGYVEQFRGWGPQLTKGVGNWFTSQDVENLAYQMLKYKNRDSWTQRDVLRLTHLRAGRRGDMLTVLQKDLFDYVVHGGDPSTRLTETVPLIDAARRMHATRKVADWVNIIGENRSLSWEMIPSEALTEPKVLTAMLLGGNLPPGAILRQLSRLTGHNVLTPHSEAIEYVAKKLTDPDVLTKARVHPVHLLIAAKTHALGYSLKGRSSWTPNQRVIDILDEGFYAAFPAVEPTGKRIMITTDTSGSMTWSIADFPMKAIEAVGAMALVTAKTEPHYSIHGFNNRIYDIAVSPRMRIDTVASVMTRSGGGSTDCAAPMLWALQNRVPVDVFQIWTDNETWAGMVHPWEALRNYRDMMGVDARLQVATVAPTKFTIADPDDPRQLDVSGFDAAVPKLLADHGRGNI